jgi:hypothetical protein
VITYRETTNVDLPAIRVLGREINALHHAAWPDVFAPSGGPQPEDFWREMIGVPHTTSFAAAAASQSTRLAVDRDRHTASMQLQCAGSAKRG